VAHGSADRLEPRQAGYSPSQPYYGSWHRSLRRRQTDKLLLDSLSVALRFSPHQRSASACTVFKVVGISVATAASTRS
jgi:hypothetical protein